MSHYFGMCFPEHNRTYFQVSLGRIKLYMMDLLKQSHCSSQHGLKVLSGKEVLSYSL